jgi:hypothetical protein
MESSTMALALELLLHRGMKAMTVLVLALLLAAPAVYAGKEPKLATGQRGGALQQWRTRTTNSVRRTLGNTREKWRSFKAKAALPTKVLLGLGTVIAVAETVAPGSSVTIPRDMLLATDPGSLVVLGGAGWLGLRMKKARRERMAPAPIPATRSTFPK